jgi:hypothetical protein
VLGGEVTMYKLSDALFGLSMEAVTNPVPFAITLALAGAFIVGVGCVATKLMERYE